MSQQDAQDAVVAAARAQRVRRALKYALPTMAALGAGSAVAAGAIPSGDGTITGCYFTGNTSTAEPGLRPGALRVIDPAGGSDSSTSTCQPDEAQLSWNQRGAQGPAGPQGSPGQQGPPGASGGGNKSALSTSTGPIDTYVKLENISGDSANSKHKGAIEAMSFSVGVQAAAASIGVSGGSAGRASFSTFEFTKRHDSSTAALLLAAASQKVIPNADITVDRAGVKSAVTEAHYKLSGVRVVGLDEQRGDGYTDQVKLSYATLALDSTAQNPDGSVGAATKASVDVTKGGGKSTGATFSLPTAALTSPTPGLDTFVKVDTVPGDSVAKAHKGEIDAQSFQYSVHTAPGTGSAGSGAGKAQFSTFDFIKNYDSASPLLFADAATGKHIAKVVVSVDDNHGDVTTYTFSNVTVNAVGQARPPGVTRTLEQVKLAFSKIETKVTTAGSTGKGTSTSAAWDLQSKGG